MSNHQITFAPTLASLLPTTVTTGFARMRRAAARLTSPATAAVHLELMSNAELDRWLADQRHR
jgi:hypothetical protein